MHDGGVTVGGGPLGATPRRSASSASLGAAPAVAPAPSARLSAASPLISLWRRAVLCFAAGFGALVVIFGDTVLDLFTSWSGSRTFTHGYFIFPISFWLVWRMRRELLPFAPEAQPFALLPLLVCGCAWLVGRSAGVHAAEQYAFVAMTPCLVWAVFGGAIARRIAFPLAFLFLAVPVGDFLTPTLIDHTANFTVEALRLSGVPVYREGNFFQIPSGNWSVVEACSGINYLIASITLGVLFAYLNYRSPTRRVAFIAASVVVPIVANWLRAYLIVMLAHVSGNALATGVDHVVYGWLFFGLVMLLLFWIGNFWRDDLPMDGAATIEAPDACEPQRTLRARPIVATVVAFAVVAAPWPALGRLAEAAAETAHPGPVVVGAIPGWAVDDSAFTSFKPHYLHARSSFAADYTSGKQKVGLFIAYYSGQKNNGSLLTYDNDVVIVSDTRWGLVDERKHDIVLPSAPVTVVESDVRGDIGALGEHLTTWRWYWINGRLTSSKEMAKGYNALDKLLGRGDDSAVVVLTTSAAHDGRAALSEFALAAEPAIAAALAKLHDEARR